MAKLRVLVDTCVIIEAFRTNCWKALCQHFAVETVEKCVEECCTGDPLQPGRVNVDRDQLMAGLAQCHPVSKEAIATLDYEVEGLPAIDDGELHLMAWLHEHRQEAVTVVLSTADRAAVRAAAVLKLLDQVKSLQELGKGAGVGPRQLDQLQEHFTSQWLGQVRLQIQLGTI